MPILLKKPVVITYSKERIFLFLTENFNISDMVELNRSSVILWTIGQLPKTLNISSDDTKKLITQYPELINSLHEYFFKVNFNRIAELFIEAPIAHISGGVR